jgi:hypothetical protein
MGQLQFSALGRRRRSHRRVEQIVAAAIIAALLVLLGTLPREPEVPIAGGPAAAVTPPSTTGPQDVDVVPAGRPRSVTTPSDHGADESSNPSREPRDSEDVTIEKPPDPPDPPIAFTIAPNPAELRPQPVGQFNGGYPVVITNSGRKSSFTVELRPGSGNSEIQLRGVCAGKTLQPGENCTELVDFTPPVTGAFQRQFSVVLNGESRATLKVSGSGIRAEAEIYPDVLTFEAERAGKITIANRGEAPLQITRVIAEGSDAKEFRWDATSCISAHVPGRGSCEITVQVVQPFRERTQQASLVVTDNSASSPHTVRLQANRYIVELTANPQPLNFGEHTVGRSSDRRVVIRNAGNAPSGPLELSAGGAFAIVVPGCRELGPGEACAVGLRFTPASAQQYTGSLVVSFPNGRWPFSVSLTGSGLPRPEVQ